MPINKNPPPPPTKNLDLQVVCLILLKKKFDKGIHVLKLFVPYSEERIRVGLGASKLALSLVTVRFKAERPSAHIICLEYVFMYHCFVF